MRGLALLLILCLLLSCQNKKPVPEENAKTAGPGAGGYSGKTKVVLLGTGTPIADPDRSGPCVAVVVGDDAYIVDFGPGVVRRAAAAARAGIKALEPERIVRAFATHLHSDHTAGYPDLILTPWVHGRNAPLEVYGPKGLQHMTDHIMLAYEEDINLRLHGNQPAIEPGINVIVHEIEPGIVYRDDNVTVKAFSVKHASWPIAFGYRFQSSDRTVVVSGDTIPVDSIVENCNGCDVLVHEAYSKAGFDKRTKGWQAYHSKAHTSGPQLAEIASRAKPKLLILYHQLLWGSTPAELMKEISDGYEGKIVYGNDLDVY